MHSLGTLRVPPGLFTDGMLMGGGRKMGGRERRWEGKGWKGKGWKGKGWEGKKKGSLSLTCLSRMHHCVGDTSMQEQSHGSTQSVN